MRAVISFHAIDRQPGPLSFAPRDLDALLGAFAETNLPVLDLPTLLAPGTERGVALTFDDGMASVHDAALPILRAHRAPAHLFLVTNRVGQDNGWIGQPAAAGRYAMLDWRQVDALQANGVVIEGHTANHPDLRMLDGPAIEAELVEANETIGMRYGRRPAYFAYPYGFHDARVRAAVGRRYAACLTTELDYLGTNPVLDAIPRLDSHYLRSPWLMKRLPSRAARGYIALRRLVRTVRGRT